MCLVSKYSHEKSIFFMVTEYYLDCHEKKTRWRSLPVRFMLKDMLGPKVFLNIWSNHLKFTVDTFLVRLYHGSKFHILDKSVFLSKVLWILVSDIPFTFLFFLHSISEFIFLMRLREIDWNKQVSPDNWELWQHNKVSHVIR